MTTEEKKRNPKAELGRSIRAEMKAVGLLGGGITKDRANLQKFANSVVKLSRPKFESFLSGNYTLSNFSPLGMRVGRIADDLEISLSLRAKWESLVVDIWLEHWANRF